MLQAHSRSGRHQTVRRAIARLSMTFVVLSAGCGEEHVTSTEALYVPPGASPEIGSAASQHDAIAELVAISTAAWTAKDAAAYASIYAEDALVINPVGGFLVGREGVRQGHVFLFSGPFAGSTQTISITGV